MIVHERRASAVLHRLLAAARPGRVVVPANVCNVVPLTVLRGGREPALVDIAPGHLTADPGQVLDAITAAPGEVAAVVLVRTYGADVDLSGVVAAIRATDPGVLVVDDRCLARPPEDAASVPLQGADAVLWSTGYGKYLDLGTGGFARLADETPYDDRPVACAGAVLDEVDDHVKHAVAAREPVDPSTAAADWLDLRAPAAGWAEHEDRIRAALPAADAHKAALEAVYAEQLPEGVSLGPAWATWRHQLVVNEPEALLAALGAAGVFASRHYPSLGGVFAPGTFPVADRLRAHVVNLFNDRYFTLAQAETTVATVRQHVARTGTVDDVNLLGTLVRSKEAPR